MSGNSSNANLPHEPASEEEEAFQLALKAEESGASTAPSKRRSRKTTIEIFTDEDKELALAILAIRKLEQKLQLRQLFAWFAVVAVSIQLIVANLLFWGYLAWPSWRSETPPQVLIAWLSAGVVEVIGIMLIIARNLFPRKDKGVSKDQTREVVREADRARYAESDEPS